MGEAAALTSALIWAFTSALLTSQTGRIPPMSMSALRGLAASGVLVALLLAAGRLGEWGAMSAATAFSMVVSGIIGQGLGDTLYINSLGLVGLSRTFPISNSAYPLLTFVLAASLLGEDVSLIIVLGGLLVVGGISILVLEGGGGRAAVGRAELPKGALFAMAAAVAWAVATVWLREGHGNLGAIATASLRIPAAALFMSTVITAGTKAPPWRGYERRSLGIVALAGLLGTGIGSVLFIFAVETAGAAKTAVLSSTAPLFALPMSVVLLSERVTPRMLLGTVISIVGIWLVIA